MTVDGRDIQGWFLPGGDGPRPLVLEIHGGPHTLYGWAPVWEFQVLAGGRDRGLRLQSSWLGGLRPGLQRREPSRLGARPDARRAGRRRGARRRRPRRPGPPRRHRRLVRRLPDELDRRSRWALPRRDDLSLGERHGRAVHHRRHLRRPVGRARIRHHAVGRPRLLPRDLAAALLPTGSIRRCSSSIPSGTSARRSPRPRLCSRSSAPIGGRSACCASPTRRTS